MNIPIFLFKIEKLKLTNTIDNIEYVILNSITNFSKTIKIRKLDGLTWKKDLTSFLETLIAKLFNNLSA
ncbi:MAG: hypothetical protein ACFE9I_13585 [Candidatus Hermodarchaeota archaeon]